MCYLLITNGSTMESRRGRWRNCWCVAVGLVICLSTYALWRCTLFVRSISGETPKHGVIKKQSDINVGCYVRSRPAVLAPCNRPRVYTLLSQLPLARNGLLMHCRASSRACLWRSLEASSHPSAALGIWLNSWLPRGAFGFLENWSKNIKTAVVVGGHIRQQ